jgi:hypothetical protein
MFNTYIALKEWAVAVEAMLKGEQSLIMRKGGIREETRDFQIASDRFYLFPTYEHQKAELIKPGYAGELADTLKLWSPGQMTVTIRGYAKLVEDIEISEQEQVDRLKPLHIWTDRFAEERLKWKRKNPLHIMILRVYLLNNPVTLPIIDSYNGCKSWIQLEGSFDEKELTPAMDGEAFERYAKQVREALK